ncbi:MAG: DUF1800 family protein [Betaproteobacteria bacterium]|nr:DUF1800 family protein [Betaproteobacteria bacterium]
MAWTHEDASHLLRRVGFGGSVRQVEALYTKGRAVAVESLLSYESAADPAWEVANPLGLKDPANDARDASLTFLYRFLASARPLEARLTWFWHSHFAPSMQAGGNALTALQLNSWRGCATGHFKDFLPVLRKDVAGLHKPNSARSAVGAAPSEAGGYHGTEAASRAGNTAVASRVLVNAQSERLPSHRAFPRAPYDLPSTTQSVCLKLYRAFVCDRAPPADLEMLMNVWGRSGGSIKSVMGAMLRGHAFWDTQARGTVLKGAMEYAAGLVQRLDLCLNRPLVENVALNLPKMGHVPFPFGETARGRSALQLSSAGVLVSRYEFARYAIYAVAPDHVAAGMTAGFPRRIPPNVFITLLAQRLGLALLTTATRAVVNEYLGNDPVAPCGTPDKVLGALYMLACSPEYQVT